MSSNQSGLSFPQTGPADLNGPSWDATAEGPQNFQEYADHGDVHLDAEDFPFHFGSNTPKKDHSEGLDDFQSKWAVSSNAEAPSAEPMRRMSSRSSNGSHKNRAIRASSSKNRSRMPSTMSR